MFSKKLFISIIFFILVLFFSSSVKALSIGGYITGAKGTYDWTYNYDSYSVGATSVESDVSKYGGGFILDTAVAEDQLFGYRLNVGYTKIKINNDKAPDIDGFEFQAYNNLCIGIFRSEYIKLWIAPQIGVGIISAKYELNNQPGINRFDTYFASAGMAAGINLHVSDLISIGLDSGYRISKHSGNGEYNNYSFDVKGTGKEFFANVAIFLRRNDNF
jgi:hypothetical protein